MTVCSLSSLAEMFVITAVASDVVGAAVILPPPLPQKSEPVFRFAFDFTFTFNFALFTLKDNNDFPTN
jgi:hypothetical protein